MLFYASQKILAMAKGTSFDSMVSPLRLFTYITFRSAGAAVTALLLSWWLGPHFIRSLKRLKLGQDYVDRAAEKGDLQARILDKRGTPTMGGVMIILILDITALLWAQWNTLILLTLLTAVVLCALGFIDDYAKITKQNSKGVQEFLKLWVQGLLAIFVAIYLWRVPATSTLISQVMIPFYKYPVLTGTAGAAVGIFLTATTIVGSSNAVNLTDGLDGLAIGCTAIVTFVFLVLTYLAGNAKAAAYLQIPHVSGAGELTVFCAAMMGASLGFLWFNCHPARVFMGDTGSLALGGVLGMIAVLIHQPLVLAIAGGVFVAEAGSVLIQRSWFKYTRARYGEGRRIFLMAPLHHHFEKLGWYESQIVTRFYILCVLCAVVALSSLKVR
ncbi:MAG TPA: phospho-N-acetylmuramoyl-pentapeptide-transferase [Candidatus Saccharimonadales bacterium]|nr:phospho-N-acetylmuramoyl-pentapeptide-transferase [Candidatus Saccharimonadales bacterium]